MVKKTKDVVKDVVKSKAASKSTYGTDPKDPWSAKANIDENITSRRADLLSKFYKSKGWNVDYITKNKKVAQSKTGEYEKWKRDHGFSEETAPIDVQKVRSHTDDSPTKKRAHQLSKAAGVGTIGTVHSPAQTGLRKEESGVYDDPKTKINTTDMTETKRMSAAVKLQRAFDRERAKSDASYKRGQEYMAQIRKQVADKDKKEVKEDSLKEMSKAAKMVKEIHDNKIAEDMYDWEKSDKQGEQYGKAPKVKKTDGVNELGDKTINARSVLQGGTTLTGQKRDTVEIDPMLKNRTSMPDYKSMDPKLTKPQ